MAHVDSSPSSPAPSYCIPCLLELYSGPDALIRDALQGVFDGLEGAVDECSACKRTNRATYRVRRSSQKRAA
jgi:hypothetical protein